MSTEQFGLDFKYFFIKKRKTEKKVTVIIERPDSLDLDIRLLEREMAEFEDLTFRVIEAPQLTNDVLKEIASSAVVIVPEDSPASLLDHKSDLHLFKITEQNGFPCMVYDHAGEQRVFALPRTDYIRAPKPESAAVIKSEYPGLQVAGRKTILFVPAPGRNAAEDVRKMIYALDNHRYTIVVKVDSDEADRAVWPRDGRVIYDSKYNVYALMEAADMVVTNHARFALETALRDKPLYLYMPETKEASAHVEGEIDFETEPIGRYVFRWEQKMARAMEEEYDFTPLHQLREKYIQLKIDDCTADLAQFIHQLITEL